MKKLWGGILYAVGILIMSGSGLCTFAVIAIGLSTDGTRDLDMLPLPLMFGGIPFVIGFGLFYWGRALVRQAKAEAAD